MARKKQGKYERMLVAYMTTRHCSAKEVFLRAWYQKTKRLYDIAPHRHHALWTRHPQGGLPDYVKRFLETQ